MDLEKLVTLGKEMGLSGKELQQWVEKERANERDRRAAEREAAREAHDRECARIAAEREASREAHERDCARLAAERELLQLKMSQRSNMISRGPHRRKQQAKLGKVPRVGGALTS